MTFVTTEAREHRAARLGTRSRRSDAKPAYAQARRRSWRDSPAAQRGAELVRRRRVIAARAAALAPSRATSTVRSHRRSLPRPLLIVAHLDLDAFFAAVEELEDPALRTVPLVVGGDPHGRGVVATRTTSRGGSGSSRRCRAPRRSAAARTPCSSARGMSLYREYSREVWSIVREIVPTVEQAGIDEGYLDLGEVAPAFDDARALAEAVRAVVRARTRLSCSLGVATLEGRREGRVRPAQARAG